MRYSVAQSRRMNQRQRFTPEVAEGDASRAGVIRAEHVLKQPDAVGSLGREDMDGGRVGCGLPGHIGGGVEGEAAEVFPEALPEGDVDEVQLLAGADIKRMAVLGAYPEQVARAEQALFAVQGVHPNAVQDIYRLGKVVRVQHGIRAAREVRTEGGVEVASGGDLIKVHLPYAHITRVQEMVASAQDLSEHFRYNNSILTVWRL